MDLILQWEMSQHVLLAHCTVYRQVVDMNRRSLWAQTQNEALKGQRVELRQREWCCLYRNKICDLLRRIAVGRAASGTLRVWVDPWKEQRCANWWGKRSIALLGAYPVGSLWWLVKFCVMLCLKYHRDYHIFNIPLLGMPCLHGNHIQKCYYCFYFWTVELSFSPLKKGSTVCQSSIVSLSLSPPLWIEPLCVSVSGHSGCHHSCTLHTVWGEWCQSLCGHNDTAMAFRPICLLLEPHGCPVMSSHLFVNAFRDHCDVPAPLKLKWKGLGLKVSLRVR